MGCLYLHAGEQAYAVQVPHTTENIDIDLDAPDALSIFAQYPQLEEEKTKTLVLATAQEMNRAGIEARQRGDWAQAYRLYRFAAAAVCHFGIWEGIDALTDSIWQLREGIKAFLHRRLLPVAGGQIWSKGGDVLVASGQGTGQHTVMGKQLAEVARRIQADAAVFLTWIKDLDSSSSLSDANPAGAGRSTSRRILRLRCLRCAADLAEDVEVREAAFLALHTLAAANCRWDAAIISTLQELTRVSLPDFLLAQGIMAPDAMKPGDVWTGFSAVWTAYLAYRQHMGEMASARDTLPALETAFAALESVRAQVVSGGGALWHRASYAVSQYLQVIGRDLVHVLTKTDQTELALHYSERLYARAMVDWMARTHRTNRLVVRPQQTGSVGEVRPVRFEEVQRAAAEAEAALLMYLANPDGYWAYLVNHTGVLVTCCVPDPEPLVAQVFRGLPYAPNAAQIGREGGVQRDLELSQTSVTSETGLRSALSALYHTLFPPEITAALREHRRLVIIADGILHYVPFCALQGEDGLYLAEKHEVVYWPSVTAWLLLKEGTPASSARQRVLVMGDPDFSRYQGQLKPLPGTAQEALAIGRLLHARPKLGARATTNALFVAPARTAVVHLATHGILDVTSPEESYLALSDDRLTARRLYQFDPGLRVGLVVLSACKTALGSQHPDSLIGLANAFLIAGANAVVSTLWPVRDDVTAEFMTLFYEQLKEGTNVAACLCQAQRKVMTRPGLSHPYYWAAFKLTGSMANPFR